MPKYRDGGCDECCSPESTSGVHPSSSTLSMSRIHCPQGSLCGSFALITNINMLPLWTNINKNPSAKLGILQVEKLKKKKLQWLHSQKKTSWNAILKFKNSHCGSESCCLVNIFEEKNARNINKGGRGLTHKLCK